MFLTSPLIQLTTRLVFIGNIYVCLYVFIPVAVHRLYPTESEETNMSSDLAGVWEVALSDGVHRIEFEHGTTTGKRVISVDGKVGITV